MHMAVSSLSSPPASAKPSSSSPDADRFRTALNGACRATGVPTFSPHDLRHRGASLWHLQGVPLAEAAAWLGHSSLEHLRTYAHDRCARDSCPTCEPLSRSVFFVWRS